jgi:hypothetical protein
MLRFIVGAIAGGMAVWIWRDDVRQYVDRRTRSLRSKAADKLQLVQEVTETALDTAKEQISAGLQSGREAIRPPKSRTSASR